jgi:hypothetical protein
MFLAKVVIVEGAIVLDIIHVKAGKWSLTRVSLLFSSKEVLMYKRT